MALGRGVPVCVPGVEQVGGLDAAHRVVRQQLGGQAGVEEGEAPPLVHQPRLGPQRGLVGHRVQAGEFLLAARATLVIVSEGGTRKLAVIHLSFIAGTRGGSPLPGLRSADPVNAVGWTSPQEISTP